MLMLPSNTPTTTEVSIITGITEQYNASGTLIGYETHYYLVPFFIWIILAVVSLYIGQSLLKTFVRIWHSFQKK